MILMNFLKAQSISIKKLNEGFHKKRFRYKASEVYLLNAGISGNCIANISLKIGKMLTTFFFTISHVSHRKTISNKLGNKGVPTTKQKSNQDSSHKRSSISLTLRCKPE